jgi:hypothetical protein
MRAFFGEGDRRVITYSDRNYGGEFAVHFPAGVTAVPRASGIG